MAARAALEPTAIVPPRRAEERNPYKGLRAFTEADALDFFGRERAHPAPHQPGWERRGPDPGSSPSSARVGAGSPRWSARDWFRRSGTGPWEARRILSSPRCSRERTPSTSSRPRSFGSRCDPVSRLHERLDSGSRGLLEAVDLVAPGEAEVVLVVDQFEEVFTLTTDERERDCSWSRFASPPPTPRAGSASS